MPWRSGMLMLCLLLLTGCSPRSPQTEILVSAAASLGPALTEAQAAFEAQEKQVRVRLNLGSSGALQQQIAQGAPADLFISAAPGPMDGLVKAGLVAESAVQTLATNQVVLIQSKATGRVTGWDDLVSARRVALGNPQHVPAGQYGRAVLERLHLWTAVEPRLILGEDVRQVLQYVESGEVDAGIVYRSDATSPKVVVVAEAPPGSHPPIRYPMAVLLESNQPAAALRFTAFLRSEAGRAILSRHGFTVTQ